MLPFACDIDLTQARNEVGVWKHDGDIDNALDAGIAG